MTASACIGCPFRRPCAVCVWQGGVDPDSLATETDSRAEPAPISDDSWDNEATPSRVNELGASPPVPTKES